MNVKPKPPPYVGRETCGHAVDSSATVIVPGHMPWVTSFKRFKNAMASRFSLPPYWFGDH
ncbi:hypothetical protein D3C83_290530 [compost metagenome]